MTLIIGTVDSTTGTVYMGGDSASYRGGTITHVERKVFRRDGYLIGGSGNGFRFLQYMQYVIDLPQILPGEDVTAFMVRRFAGAVRDGLKEHGNLEIERGGVETMEGTLLVGYRRNLFYMSAEFAMLQHSEGFEVTGCGEDFAIGAYAALEYVVDPKERILKTLEITGQHSYGVRPPYYVEML
jgi:hypothetical protein